MKTTTLKLPIYLSILCALSIDAFSADPNLATDLSKKRRLTAEGEAKKRRIAKPKEHEFSPPGSPTMEDIDWFIEYYGFPPVSESLKDSHSVFKALQKEIKKDADYNEVKSLLSENRRLNVRYMILNTRLKNPMKTGVMIYFARKELNYSKTIRPSFIESVKKSLYKVYRELKRASEPPPLTEELTKITDFDVYADFASLIISAE